MLTISALFLWAGSAHAKKQKGPPPVIEGWHQELGWAGFCYYPPDFAVLLTGPRKEARQKTLEAMMSQWRGERNDGVSFPSNVSENVETTILAKMERLELVAKDNLEKCKAGMAAGSMAEWGTWLSAVPGQLTVGECMTPPLDYTMYDYLSINNDWQFTGHVCKGDRVKVKGSEMDYYQLEPKGLWVNAAGDTSASTSGAYPCNLEGCYAGMLILKYTSATGVSTVLPVGLQMEFLAPDHGKIQLMINDTELTDNKYKVEARLEHHMAIEYSAAK